MPENPFSFVGYAIAMFTILVTWLANRRKGDVDESTLILGKWKELVEQHEKTLAVFNSDIGSLRSRLETAEKTIAELLEARARDRKRIIELEDENAGLKTNMRQSSQSAIRVLGKATARADATEKRQEASETRADLAEDRQTEFARRQNVNDERVLGMEDEIHKLDTAGSNSKGRKSGDD